VIKGSIEVIKGVYELVSKFFEEAEKLTNYSNERINVMINAATEILKTKIMDAPENDGVVNKYSDE